MNWRAAFVIIALLVVAGAVAVSVPRCNRWEPPAMRETEEVAATPTPVSAEQATPGEEEVSEEPTPTPEAGAEEGVGEPTPAAGAETPTPPVAEGTPVPGVVEAETPTSLAGALGWRLKADAEVADRQIAEAQRALQQDDFEGTAEHIRHARTAILFLHTEIPAILAMQALQRADVLAGSGNMREAMEALEEAEALAGDVKLDTSLKTFRGHLASARSLLRSGSGQRAREEIAAMSEAVQADEVQELVGKIIGHLEGALFALERRSAPVTKAELEEAKSAIYQLGNAIEEHTSSAS